MRGVHADMITQVLSELSELYRGDKATLSRQLEWIQLLLERTDTIQPSEKEKIRERLAMDEIFDQLWEESPRTQKLRERIQKEARAKYLEEGVKQGTAQGITQGTVQGSQNLLLRFVQTQFPNLTEFAQKKVKLCDDPDTLEQLFQQLITAPDVMAAQHLLEAIPEQQI
jgi:flagellar biosynthesis/type III secretory pathway protein FliH